MQVIEGYVLLSKNEYDQLCKQVELLTARVKELEAMLHKDSSNSSKPPSSDWYNKITKNRKQKSDKKIGGQPGHEGETLEMVEHPDHLIEHKVEKCDHCGMDLSDVRAEKYHRRQVHDLPPVKIEVTEHRVEVKQCKVCGKTTIADCDVPASVQYGEKIKSMAVYFNQYQFLPFERTKETMNDLFGCAMSAEVIKQSNEQCYERLEPVVEEQIKTSLINSAVMNCDETGLRCENDMQWVHSYSTDRHTYYAIDEKRGGEAMERINILPRFKGICEHDRWASYDQYEEMDHALCNNHLMRDLEFVEEAYNKSWAEKMQNVLIEGLHLSRQEKMNKIALSALETRYDRIVKKAIKEEPPAVITEKKKRGRKARSEPLKLAECFLHRKEDILRFLHDPRVPFGNNLAERDIRMIKLKQKISGCFRTRKGAEIFCRIRSYISTLKKQNKNVWDALQLTIRAPSTQLIAV